MIETELATEPEARRQTPEDVFFRCWCRVRDLVREIAEIRLAGLEARARAMEAGPLKRAGKQLAEAWEAVEGSALRCEMEQVHENEKAATA